MFLTFRVGRTAGFAGFLCAFSLASAAEAQLIVQSAQKGGTTPSQLVAQLAPGVAVSDVSLSADSRAAGTFSGGETIGFELSEGILLSSGSVEGVAAPNDVNNPVSSNWGRPGDDDFDDALDQLSVDAAVLAFRFQCPPASTRVEVDYVFATEEAVWDGVAILVDGANIAELTEQVPLTTENLLEFEGLFLDNTTCDGTSCPFNLAADFISVKLTASGSLTPALSEHHFKVVVADGVDDPTYDSWVFVREFRCLGQATTAPVLGSLGSGFMAAGILGSAMLLLHRSRRRG